MNACFSFVFLDFVGFFRASSRSLLLAQHTYNKLNLYFSFSLLLPRVPAPLCLPFSFYSFYHHYFCYSIFHLLDSSELLSFESFASSFSTASSNRCCWNFFTVSIFIFACDSLLHLSCCGSALCSLVYSIFRYVLILFLFASHCSSKQSQKSYI